MKYSAVVLDLDGTLLNSTKQISDRNYKAVLNCHAQGMRIIIATARPPRAVNSFLPKELIEIASMVYYNGALVSCKYTGIHLHEPIEAELTAKVLDHCCLVGNPEIDLSLEVQDEWFSLKEYDCSVIMNVKGNPIVTTLDELKKYDATKILLSGNVNVALLKDNFASQLNILVTDHGTLVQVASKKASKERAVTIICERLGVGLDKVIAFGDDHNDLGLFYICGWSVAMGNAVEELKAISSEVTDTNDNDGVAKVLERILS